MSVALLEQPIPAKNPEEVVRTAAPQGRGAVFHFDYQPQPEHSTKRHNGAGWLVSFADLLTLLVCFFLAVVASSPLAPSGSNQKKQALTKGETTVERDSVNTRFISESGTPLAGNKSGSGYPPKAGELFLTSEQLRGSQFERSISALVLGGIGERATIEVSTCASGRNAVESSTETALALKIALEQRGVVPAQIRFRPLGRHCEVIRDEAYHARTVAKVVISSVQ